MKREPKIVVVEPEPSWGRLGRMAWKLAGQKLLIVIPLALMLTTVGWGVVHVIHLNDTHMILDQSLNKQAIRSSNSAPWSGFGGYGYEWRYVEINATQPDHFNLNQGAREGDATAQEWTQVFNVEGVRMSASDTLYFCGDYSPITVQIRMNDTMLEGFKVEGVQPCHA